MQNMFKVNTEVTRTTSMMSSDVFIVNFEHILHHFTPFEFRTGRCLLCSLCFDSKRKNDRKSVAKNLCLKTDIPFPTFFPG